MKKKAALRIKTVPKIDWQLVGVCQTCVAPVFYAFSAARDQVHIWRTCNHATPPQFGAALPDQPAVPAPEVG